ncbi:MAG: helix-turn-helix transcriptional regulator [Candidatus Gastranaerophilales bacterium]|nr:helix-turn-helix transcriptional regulator [Candidatus Gastranaerophilales bacterium]
MNNIKTLFGKRIAELRKEKGLTQEKLAELIGMATPTLGAIEIGKYFTQPKNMIKIAEALGVEIHDLFYFKDINDKEQLLDEIKNNIEFIKDNDEKLLALYKFIKVLL